MLEGPFPWERNFNSGPYLGEKTFSVTPGGSYGILFVPRGTVEQVRRNPLKTAWLSPRHPEQIADVTGEGTLIATEDTIASRFWSDRDYNDIVFKISGGEADLRNLDGLVNPNRDWRQYPLGQEIIEYASQADDTEAPALQATLADDTGFDNTDGLTNDPTVTGSVSDESEIVAFLLGVNGNNAIDASAWLQEDGSFELDRAALETAFGSELGDGSLSLIIEAEDAWENGSQTEITIDLDTTPANLDIASPSENAELTGEAVLAGSVDSELAELAYGFGSEDLAIVDISEINDGAFEVPLDASSVSSGSQVLRVVATDRAGNESTVEIPVEIPVPDETPPVLTAELIEDTGADDSDRYTKVLGIRGTARDDGELVSLRAGFNDTPEQDYLEVISILDSGGNFELDESLLGAIMGEPLPDGQYTLHLVAEDAAGNISTKEVEFVLDTEATSVPTSLDLLAKSDSGKSDRDNITNDNMPTLAGTIEQPESESLVLVYSGEELIAQTEASSSWEVTTDQLPDGQQNLEVKVIDKAGNESEALVLEILVDTLEPQIDLSNPAPGGTVTPKTPLAGSVDGTGSEVTALSYQFDSLTGMPIPFVGPTGQFNESFQLDELIGGFHNLNLHSEDLAGNTTTKQIGVTVDPTVPFEIADYKPLDGGIDVGVTYKPQVFFSKAVDPATLNSDNFFATMGGNKLAAKIVPADTGEFAWLFFQDPLPDASSIRVTVDGSSIMSLEGNSALDADGDGTPGGEFSFDFSTVSLTPLPNTALSGIVADPGPDLKPYTSDDVDPGADGEFHTADDTFLLPIEGVKVFAIGLENEAIFTGPDGRFRFDAMPAGNVKLVVDGLTATNAPSGSYFPEMVMDVNISPGVENSVMFGMPEIFLPRLNEAILQPVNINRVRLFSEDAGTVKKP